MPSSVEELAADTESASEADVMLASAPHKRRASVGRRAALALAASLVVAAAGAIVSFARPAAVSTMEAALEVSADSASEMLPRMGCSNWEEMLIGEHLLVSSSERLCRSACEETPGCSAYNLEASGCTNKGSSTGKAANTCYVYAGTCKEQVNHCWDLYLQSNSTVPWSLHKERSGCQNWAFILLAQHSVRSMEQCAAKCTAEGAACKHFNYQVAGGLHGDRCRQGEDERGSCFLYREGCEVVPNACWDLYAYTSHRVTTTASPTTTGTPSVGASDYEDSALLAAAAERAASDDQAPAWAAVFRRALKRSASEDEAHELSRSSGGGSA